MLFRGFVFAVSASEYKVGDEKSINLLSIQMRGEGDVTRKFKLGKYCEETVYKLMMGADIIVHFTTGFDSYVLKS